MLTRIYIDNFKGLVNFELKDLGAINLFLGENGAGKSTVFEALRFIKMLMTGESETHTEIRAYLTQPITKYEQIIKLDISSNEGIYTYEVTCKRSESTPAFLNEVLYFNQHLLMEVTNATAKIYGDDLLLNSSYSFRSIYSILNTIPATENNIRLTWFREQIQRWIIIQPTPSRMYENSEKADSFLDYDTHNFTSWYRYLCQDGEQEKAITQNLIDYLPWFQGFEFISYGASKVLFVNLPQGQFRFDSLSDGQRVLIVLYTLMTVTRDQNYLLCLDEPENYLALPEIQPWLVQLEEHCEAHDIQALLISHHPELIDYLGTSSSHWFSYNTSEIEGIKVKRLPEHDPRGVSLSELIARGWLDDEAN